MQAYGTLTSINATTATNEIAKRIKKAFFLLQCFRSGIVKKLAMISALDEIRELK